ncbi:MAG: urease accessory protein UreD [Oculatellaceae cyanobacterium bins.114]|nr:urease accessory protein UreD [Oculatellaceae cyanobacterium bins.114]
MNNPSSIHPTVLTQLTPAMGWHGSLQLEFAHDSRGTHLNRSYVQAPLKVQRPFYPEGTEVCHLVTLHTAGGVVGGDRLSLDITLDPHAHALITTAAAGKVYRSNGQTAQQTVQIHVAESACLEWLPQESIVFDGAHYQQNVRIDLAENALWMGWELTRLGRTARGEQFLSGVWRSHTQVWQNNQPIWIDPQRVEGGSEMLTSLHGLASCPVVGSFAVIGRSLDPELVEKARSLWQPGTGAINRVSSSPPQIGVTRLTAGLLCRYRGHSTLEARRWFTQVWHLMRQEVLNRPGCNPRVW